MSDPINPVPEGRPGISPYLIVPDGERILAFLQEAFGAEVLEQHHEPDGRLTHAEVRIGDSVVMIGQSTAEWTGFKAMIHVYVPDVDAVVTRALAAGGRSVREVATQDYGDRTGGVEDPAGNQWWIASRVAAR